MQRIRKGDEVIVTTGKYKGTKGTVTARVVERQIVVKKAVRPNPMINQPGGIVDKTMPIDQSNVMLFNPASKKGERVSFKIVDGKKVRVFKDGSVVGAKA